MIGTRSARRPGRHPHRDRSDADLAKFVLAALDAHLACLTAIRADLASPRPTRPGKRWDTVAASVVAARRYATLLTGALRTPTATARPASRDNT